ncbi:MULTISPECIES: acyltransferase family protein [unclassified Enterococcus]|uniref:acyltransferase family protein n=1 Tax=unclassified Enterococcus TaxID=2608891 RepID=UPI0015581F6D|nr:acetyltransferase [Enterococcus sp. MMGLQ5-2]MBS7583478.1 acetyltransferase [Enterococcus sp. MMGLQ5-1]NPD11338.1 acetyltransferase [Enterococcus sp. MMGLQ5-1]NPD36081.1 acetyltransferase [Enterococcus sp. MMGLQ5-2]
MQRQKARYITGFDGIRAISVIGVILYHILPEIMKGGYLGVVVFFVLSGYLITDLMLQEYERNEGIDILGFYQRRMRRLFPALIAVLLGSSIYMVFFQRDLMTNFRGVTWSTLTYLNNWWQIFNGASYFDHFINSSPFTHIWSLAIEGQFYFVWPILFVLLLKLTKSRRGIFIFLFGLSIASAVWMAILFSPNADPSRVYYGTDTRIFSILIGVAFAFIMPSNRMKQELVPRAKRTLNHIGLGALAILLFLFFFLNDKTPFIYYGGMWLVSLISIILVLVCAHPGSSLNRWLTNPFFSYLGKRSYGIYLYQYPIMIFFETKVKDINRHLMIYSLVEIVLILIVSELSYRLIELPLKRFDYRKLAPKIKQFFKEKPNLHKLPGYVMTVLVVIGVCGMIFSPSKQSEAALKIEEEIKKNAEILKAQKKTETEIKKLDQAQVDELRNEFQLTDKQIVTAHEQKITAFGDSILLSASDALTKIYPEMVVDADVGRQLYSSSETLQNLAKANKLEATVLISLGTNGSFTESQFDDFMKVLGDRQVYWLTVHVPTKRWQEPVNQLLEKMTTKYSNLKLIDWYNISLAHPDWFYEDDVHPNEAGKVEYVKAIVNQIDSEK